MHWLRYHRKWLEWQLASSLQLSRGLVSICRSLSWRILCFIWAQVYRRTESSLLRYLQNPSLVGFQGCWTILLPFLSHGILWGFCCCSASPHVSAISSCTYSTNLSFCFACLIFLSIGGHLPCSFKSDHPCVFVAIIHLKWTLSLSSSHSSSIIRLLFAVMASLVSLACPTSVLW